MAKAKRPSSRRRTSAVPRNSRATISGAANPGPTPPPSDDLAAKFAGTDELASSFPFNVSKALEYDSEAALAPEPGLFAVPRDPIVGASTVTEANGSEKVGSGSPPIGQNKT